MMNDAQLLTEYVHDGSESAFTELIHRHLGLVHSAALRQTGDRTLAEDVSQAVFLLLARKAPTLDREVVLAGWLFRTTRFVAARAARTEGRRRRREEEALAMIDTQTSEDPWKRIAPELDEALGKLGDAERDAVLLRFGEGRNHREVGAALGIAEDAAKKRVHRGLEKLRTLLLSAGVAVSPTALGEILSERMLVAPPLELGATIGSAIATPAAVSDSVAELARTEPPVGAAAPWFSWSLAGLSAAAVLLITFSLLRFGFPSASRAIAPSDPPARPPREQPALAQSTRATVTGPTFTLRVVSAETGEPIAGATVPVLFDPNITGLHPADYVTDGQGVCRIPLPAESPGEVYIGVNIRGWEQRFFAWTEESVEPLPNDYTLRLRPALTMGGRVVDTTGKPLPNTTVSISFRRTGDGSEVLPERMGYITWGLPVATTDSEGRWIMGVVPAGVTQFSLGFQPPDQLTGCSATHQNADGDGFTQALLAGTALTTLPPGFSVSGTIVDPAGKPVAGAAVEPLPAGVEERVVRTDAAGRFRVGRLAAGPHRLGVTADGFAPAAADIELRTASVRVPEIRLQPGGVVRVRVVDPQTNPIANVRVEVDPEAGSLTARYGLLTPENLGQVGWEGVTDTLGIVEWRGAPKDSEIPLRIWTPKWRTFERIVVRADAGERQIVLQPIPLQLLTGRVVAADTGEPIQNFAAIPSSTLTGSIDRDFLQPGSNGTFQFRRRTGLEIVRIEAEGFESAERAPERAPDGSLCCDFALRRFGPNSIVRGVVLGLDGQPAANTDVTLTTVEHNANLTADGFIDQENSKIVRTDASGRFQFPPARGPHSVVALTSAGFARERVRPGSPLKLRLQPLGSIRGTVEQKGKTISGFRVSLSVPEVFLPHRIQSGGVSLNFSTTTDTDGRFRFDRVPPGDWQLRALTPVAENFFLWASELPVTVSPRVEADVRLGTELTDGCRVTGRLATSAPGIVEDWDLQTRHSLSRVFSKPQPPAGLSPDETRLWFMDWVDSPAGRVVARSVAQYSMKISADGSFIIGGVAPGEYRLDVSLNTEAGRLNHTVIVPPESAGTTLDLGTLTLKANQVSK